MKIIRYVLTMLLVFLMLIPGIMGADESEGTTLKIGTPNVVKSPSLFGDYYLGIFGHLSNPPLMRMDQDGSLVGQTAESYQASTDGEVWTFYIDDDLYWSDGVKVTPEDVKFSIEYLAENQPEAGWIEEKVSDISVTDDAVVIELNEPYTTLDLEFATYNIFPKHIWEEIDDPTEYTNEGEYVGCGPFYIAQTDLGAGIIRFQKNPYWKKEQPQVDSVEIHVYNNIDVLSLALEKGEIDTYYKYAGTYPYPNIQKLEDAGNFDLLDKDNVGLVLMGMNLHKEPMSDPRFREAISYAINYQEILRLDALGYGEVPNRGFVPPSMANFKETETLEYDPSKAKELLAEAGYVDSDDNGLVENLEGEDLELLLLARPDEYERICELIQEYLGEVGIKVELKMVERSTWVELKDDYQYDLTVTRTTPWGMLMHANWGTGYFDSRRTGAGVLHILDDPQFLELCDDILSTTDQDERQEYAYQVQDYYAENLPAIALYWNKVVTPFNNEYTGWTADPLFGIYSQDNFLNVQKA